MSGMGLPLVDQLKTRMQWLQTRQKLLAENVANADTPNFRPRDLQALSAPGQGGGIQLEATSAGHITTGGGPGAPGGKAGQRFETRPSGNSVTLEDEMTKLADTQMDYQAVASLYSKSLSLLKIAIGKRG
ncbi:flagellar basal body rod protein FlgB [Alsobacter metallidurans]|uniref:Flagellar basal body rod protein FlgB n=1 Tax=Alsobacter metallidurans TaxID=340221 RepID=A0A917IAH7_9HYPH|nr:flagellar basal body rod protein FlgB [Alsobacter metallidurans]GGH26417.1 flagellar basal body rod protein FlgB [Alsobacter metallidurans]